MFFFHICWREQRAVRISLHQCSTSSTAWLRCGWRRLSTPYLQPQRCSAQVRPGIKSAVKLRIGKAKLLGCCCKAVSVFLSLSADRASLQAASCVEKMQELILDLLSRLCGTQAGAARGGAQRFGRLLGRLTELRTLRHNYLLLTRQQSGHWQWRCARNSENLQSFMSSLQFKDLFVQTLS